MVQEGPGGFPHGFIFDPWGARIELLQDPGHPGFHHVHLSAIDPDVTLAWYRDLLEAETGTVGDSLEGLRLGSLWLLASPHAEGVPAATEGRSIDHIAFEVDDLESESPALRSRGVEFLQEAVVPDGARTSAKRAFVAGPDNVRLALVEPGFAGVEAAPVADVLTMETGPYDVPRTPWGEPDLQGVWTVTRPMVPRWSDRRRTSGRTSSHPRRPWPDGSGVRWAASGATSPSGAIRRWDTSAPVCPVRWPWWSTPPEGRLPSTTPAAEARMDEVQASREATPAGPENLSPWVRCITRGPIPMPQVYNNGLQIVQGPGYVAVTREMVHETRVIPTDGRSHLGDDLTSYLGDPSGYWDGDTLVVEITNFNGKAPFPSDRVQGLLGSGYGSSEALTLTERYTRTGPDTLLYEFTFDDPSMWASPWTGMYTWVKDDTQYELVEYSCHEGNYGMFNILTGARATEAAAEAAEGR